MERLITACPDPDHAGLFGTRSIRALLASCLIGCLLLFASLRPAFAADDWLDDMPSVAAIVDVVRQQATARVQQNPQLASNEDLFPTMLMGTFVLMRWVMEFQVETLGQMSPERTQRMRRISNDYMQAEYAISLGTARRNGYIRTECQRNGPNRAGFQNFPSADACHRYVTQSVISNVYASFTWRNTIFPLLFCDRAKIYLDLMQNNILTLPAPIRSPAIVGVMPDRGVLLGAAFCNPYGGDANQNGLCDDWEKKASIQELAASASSPCAPIVMDTVKLAQGGGLKVVLTKWGGKLGQTAGFRVLRSDKEKLDTTAVPIWSGDAPIELTPDGQASMQVLLAKGMPMTLDKARPYFIVEVTRGKSPGPANCEMPLDQWLPRQLGPISGLHGPYSTADVAVQVAGKIALQLTSLEKVTVEAGFLILRDPRIASGPSYFTTTPTLSSDSTSLVFQPGDYWKSLGKAFETSCEEFSNFVLAATVHTHPIDKGVLPNVTGIGADNNNLSMRDFEQAVQLLTMQPARFVPGQSINSRFEKIYMISEKNRCIQWFVPRPLDLHFSEAELKLNDLYPTSVALYNEYLKRQGRVCGIY